MPCHARHRLLLPPHFTIVDFNVIMIKLYCKIIRANTIELITINEGIFLLTHFDHISSTD